MTPDEITRLTQEIAVDACWTAIETASLNVEIEGEEWLDLTTDLDEVKDEIRLLEALKLLEVHPAHPTLVREIAEL